MANFVPIFALDGTPESSDSNIGTSRSEERLDQEEEEIIRRDTLKWRLHGGRIGFLTDEDIDRMAEEEEVTDRLLVKTEFKLRREEINNSKKN